MSLRQRLASDISAGRLTHNPLVETGADRIGALGRSDPLGAALWRILADHDRTAVKDAVSMMARRLKHAPKGRDVAHQLCWVVLQEWLDDKCKKCKGRGLVYNAEGVADACTVCEGTRLRRYSDTERARAMGWGIDTYRKWEATFAQAHAMLHDADAAVGRGVAYQLERGRLL
jgi:hypothetical protein